MLRSARMKRELQLFEESPPHGISCWMINDSVDQLQAQILGPEDTPYHNGVFKLEIIVPERYPIEPPKIRFLTPIYHPNIDSAGRICLDSLKMPPKGAWKPALNLSTVLTTILLLMSEPNPDDPLMTDIAEEFRCNKSLFEQRAAEWTKKYAMDMTGAAKAYTKPAKIESGGCVSSESETSGNSSDSDSDTENRNRSGNKRHGDHIPSTALCENVKKLKK